MSPVLQTTAECSCGTSGGNADAKAQSSSSLLVAGAGAGTGAVRGVGVAERDEMPIRLANGSAAGCGGGGVNARFEAGWGVAELEAGGDVNEEKAGEDALERLFPVTVGTSAGLGISEDGLETVRWPTGLDIVAVGHETSGVELTLLRAEPQGDIACLTIAHWYGVSDIETQKIIL